MNYFPYVREPRQDDVAVQAFAKSGVARARVLGPARLVLMARDLCACDADQLWSLRCGIAAGVCVAKGCGRPVVLTGDGELWEKLAWELRSAGPPLVVVDYPSSDDSKGPCQTFNPQLSGTQSLSDNDEDLTARLVRSRQALAAWSHEASLPWVNKPLVAGIAATEVSVLRQLGRTLGDLAASETERAMISSLVADWEAIAKHVG